MRRLGKFIMAGSLMGLLPSGAADLSAKCISRERSLATLSPPCVCPATLCVQKIKQAIALTCGAYHAQMDHAGMHHDHAAIQGMEGIEGPEGMFGRYPMTREASGTSWAPDSSPHGGVHVMKDKWSLMLHGSATLAYDSQEGKRSADKTFGASMFMLMATRAAGPGKLGVRAMVSADPLSMGRLGYPLLLQTGETAEGKTPLIDRQHPHDLFMELAASYTLPLSATSSVFAYFGMPGEPALGPPAFVHRFSGEEIPAAPLGHHWLDSTHVEFGVATLGFVRKNLKLESSVFTGREPDERRYDIDRPRFDSYAFRVSYNPTSDWALEAGFGNIRSREQLEPNVNTGRVTLSAIYNKNWSGNNWQSILAWGRNIDRPKHTTDAFLLESALAFREKHTVMGRLERIGKDGLFEPPDPMASEVFTVGEASLGYVYDFYRAEHFKAGLGGLVTASLVPAALKPSYGSTPLSGMVFLRLRLR